MNLDFKCLKCGYDKYQVATCIIPEKNNTLKLELGKYYIKTCLHCGYSEMYSAKIIAQNEKNELYEPAKS
ncbi:hypothetical protein [Fusobacterium sp. PH5-44]|uniref:hypothetical protein n=1 Tax=Fusobacterium sp. PH5-44 TaxID=2940518 RepID=UPI003D1D39C5